VHKPIRRTGSATTSEWSAGDGCLSEISQGGSVNHPLSIMSSMLLIKQTVYPIIFVTEDMMFRALHICAYFFPELDLAIQNTDNQDDDTGRPG
jgi:hypothetical protein